ncbi:zinc finger-containing ubiquitin peptidase 1 isoform X1 [Electrophorus electricus]|uniref:zinc finger-containing ubiquitin peptidase 1 isoform X1 n=1 Tax=Electrophorus electricus TaxID=8005 RepID=UPI0015D03946|nr:zinc finger-containing ubiquitin peptidase 1 isoform X1 [Electrophorus electricus]
MPFCEICSEVLESDSDMRTHLLLSHLENEMSCPFCSLSGVSYDDLHFHICTAHKETDSQHSVVPSATGNARRSSAVTEITITSAKGTSEYSPAVRKKRVTQASSEASGHHALCLKNGATASNAGTALTQGATSREEASRTAVAAPSRTKKPLRHAPNFLGRQAQEEPSKHHKSKQQHLSSKKGHKFTCPMCTLVCADCFILQEHVELHLQDQAECEGVQKYECPLCSVTCVDSSSLQEHVELHLEYGPTASEGDSCRDLRLARKLQEEEEQKRKAEGSRQEAEDFKQLQRQFGLDNGGGYRRQMERSLERAVSQGRLTPADFHRKRVEMMESLASGMDDGRTQTTGLLAVVYEFYQREACAGTHVWLCADTDHYSTSAGDRGWGCGYRNFQMLLSSLQRMEQYNTALNTLRGSIPSIPQVQALIEAAWAEGVDPQGASHFSGRLQGTRAWIGATEIYAVLTAHQVRARIFDFHQPTGPSGTHPKLFEWVKNYFSLPSSRGSRLPPRVVKTTLPPIYLQHQGHSRSIVGVEQRRNGSMCLLLLDPGSSPAEMRKLLTQNAASASITHMRKFPGHLKHRQYQMVLVEGLLSPEEKQIRILNSKTLHAERIP